MTNKVKWFEFNTAVDQEEDYEGWLAFDEAAEYVEDKRDSKKEVDVNDAPDQKEVPKESLSVNITPTQKEASKVWRDFNDAADQKEDFKFDAKALRDKLQSRLSLVLPYLFPAGKINGKHFTVGNINGDPGKSLVVELEGHKAGMWIDFATGEGGDILSALASVMGIDRDRNFPQLLESIAQWLGEPNSIGRTTNRNDVDTKTCNDTKKLHSHSSAVNQNHADTTATNASNDTQKTPKDNLGQWTAKWDYTDTQGNIIACVYRYDTPEGKTFRPWDVKAGIRKAPDPRPLYNQVQIAASNHVVLVEGEKAADALIKQGIVATTAMNGAHAPVSKTDWSQLKDKHVLVWPDQDEAGKTYATRAAEAVTQAGASSVDILEVPKDKPEKWDAFDAVEEGMDISAFIRRLEKTTLKAANETITELPSFYLVDMLSDVSPMPDDLIWPRLLTPGGMAVFGGAPKVGKSDFLLSLLVRMAAGEPFLGLKPPRPLRIFYLQSEIEYHYLRERLHDMRLPQDIAEKAFYNLCMTSQAKLTLNDLGTAKVVQALKKFSAKGGLDILVIDPIRNMFDGGPETNSENDNNAMLFFLQQRVEKMRDAINPKAGIILVHHTRKMFKRQLEDDPFQALSGASSLRSFYTTGMLLYRPDEEFSERRLMFELRNGKPLKTLHVDKEDGQWVKLDPRNPRLIQKEHGAKHDDERIRKKDVIVQLIFDEASQGRVYTANQFANAFEGKEGLGGERTIRQRISVLATKGYIKFFRNADEFGFPPLPRNKFGYLCVEDMNVPNSKSDDGSSNNEINDLISVKPTHYKCPHVGIALPVEDANEWVCHEEHEYE